MFPRFLVRGFLSPFLSTLKKRVQMPWQDYLSLFFPSKVKEYPYDGLGRLRESSHKGPDVSPDVNRISFLHTAPPLFREGRRLACWWSAAHQFLTEGVVYCYLVWTLQGSECRGILLLLHLATAFTEVVYSLIVILNGMNCSMFWMVNAVMHLVVIMGILEERRREK